MKLAIPDRQSAIDPDRTVLLVIDAQKGILNPATQKGRPYYYRTATDIAVPNIVRLLTAARQVRCEVIYTVIASLTKDGRDRSLDYKQTSFHFGPRTPETEVIDALAPGDDDIVIPKTSSSLFNSTNFEYIVRNIGLDTIIVTGFLTDQCVDHTVRDGADRGFRMICPADACTTDSEARHLGALSAFKGYCRLTDTATLLEEFAGAPRAASVP